MQIPAAPSETVHLRWVGVFVVSVGLFYLYPFAGSERARRRSRLATVLEVTAMARVAVGLFVASAMAAGALVWQWSSVLVTDWALAAVQILMLRRGAFTHE